MMLPATRRVFLLLGAYEDLTERESGALRRGNLDYAIGLENRKIRLARALAEARRAAPLSETEVQNLRERVDVLSARERDNLALLGREMARVRTGLQELRRATHRSRQVRRSYVGVSPAADGVLARA